VQEKFVTLAGIRRSGVPVDIADNQVCRVEGIVAGRGRFSCPQGTFGPPGTA
jgi:hypothetical protein